MSSIFSFPLGSGINKTGLPLIPLMLKDATLCFLIDTGATHNAIFYFIYEHFKSEFTLKDTEQSIMGIEGNSCKTFAIEATLGLEGRRFTSVFSVLDASKAVEQVFEETGIQLHGVLSTNFLVENKWILDFNKQEIRIYEK